MPATESTSRDLKLMHVVFGVSAVVLLGSTVWMLAKDHNREWKSVQREMRDIDAQFIQWRENATDTRLYQEQTRELEEKVAAANAEIPAPRLVDAFIAEVESDAASRKADVDVARIREAYEAVTAAGESRGEDLTPVRTARAKLMERLDASFAEAKFHENASATRLKVEKSLLDKVRSDFDLGVGNGLPEAELAKRQKAFDEVRASVSELTLANEQAKTHRKNLEAILGEMNAPIVAAQKELDDHLANLNRLQTSFDERAANYGKSLLEMPILDAFMGPLKPDQIWLPKLTINNNFKDVARFDRCTTCHQAIDKTAPGTASEPAYPLEHLVTIVLPTPAAPPTVDGPTPNVTANEGAGETEDAAPAPEVKTETVEATATLSESDKLRLAYGLQIAQKGIRPTDVAISVVWPETPAAAAGLEPGDVITKIGDATITKRADGVGRLIGGSVPWGKPLTLTVLRGLPHPYASHPRLDLYVGPASPHKKAEMGCTICHDGQGGATEFKWASHAPNNPAQAKEWEDKYGWFNNHHWIFPMTPNRFVESMCLKCHHDVMELQPSRRFPEPPAPKLMAGHALIQDYGCFGCHEINGFKTPTDRNGPDLRAEPAYYAAAQQVLADEGITDEIRQLAQLVAIQPDDVANRKQLAELIQLSFAPPTPANEGEEAALADVTMTERTRAMADLLKADDATPGQFRKVGPSLRYVGHKLDENFLYSWIRDPWNFRPTTKMPRVFGLWEHLEEGSKGLAEAQKFEPVEIAALSHYLLEKTQKFDYVEPWPGVTAKPDLERGKAAFQLRGCLTCHEHPDFPKPFVATQGPNLAELGSKLVGEKGRKWLYSWVREPNRYHVRTTMPNLFLEPITAADGTVSDPAADITEYLLSSHAKEIPAAPQLNAGALDELVMVHLRNAFTESQAKQFMERGIPNSLAKDMKGDEAELVLAAGEEVPEEPTAREEFLRPKKLMYIGRRTITKQGCTGCHDIPGYEDAKPIGTGLADWGRKETSKLAFEQVVTFLERQLAGDDPHAGAGHHGIDHDRLDQDTAYFVEKLEGHEREGFLWQKLHAPRSFDYRKTENKTYLERLRMPRFNFNDQQVEQVMTFVLGLVAEPPAAQFVYKPDARQSAILAGRNVLQKYNCGGCHMLDMEVWRFNYDSKWFAENNDLTAEWDDYAFLEPHFTPEQIAASKRPKERVFGSATVVGMPLLTDEDEIQETEDASGEQMMNYFTTWENVPIEGHVFAVGSADIGVQPAMVKARFPSNGGDLAKYLHPIVLANERAGANPAAKASDAWGWLPPPLLREGTKVQSDWLYEFLLSPYEIRPATVLRMPNFHMSQADARALSQYFAAVDDAAFPTEYSPKLQSTYLAEAENERPQRLEDAMKIVMDGQNFCVKCHLLGDYVPPGDVKALAPNLERVYKRLRPDFTLRWVANPKRLLPYTGMPVNFPHSQEQAQNLFQGTSEQQLNAVVDLLLNYDTFMKSRTSYKSQIVAPPPAAPGAGSESPE